MKKIFIFCVCALVFLSSCYHLENAAKNNGKRKVLFSAVEKSPTRSLFESLYANNKEEIAKNKKELENLLKFAIDKQNYFEALRFYKTLQNVNDGGFFENPPYFSETETESFLLKKIAEKTAQNGVLPSTTEEATKATCTILIDKGVKIEGGSGFLDRVIGSGFFIDEKGYIITNHHVIKDLVDPKNKKYSKLYVKLNDERGRKIPASVVGFDEMLDLALLKCEITPPFILRLGQSGSLKVGEKLIAIGTPLGLEGTVTSGIISNVARPIFAIANVFQIDAAINAGNSGGPCIDKNNFVQAVAFAGIENFQALNFAIPVEYLKEILPRLYSEKEIHHAWLSLYGKTKLEGRINAGVEILYLMKGTEAQKSLMREGDVITKINGKDVNSLEELHSVLRSLPPDLIVPVTYISKSKKKSALIYLEERPKNPGYKMYLTDVAENSFIHVFGMRLTHSSEIWKNKFTITSVIEESLADEMGFSPSDPLYIRRISFEKENSVLVAAIDTRKRKKGYLDMSMSIMGALDSQNYF